MADTKAQGPAKVPSLKQLKAREQQLAARKARLRQELDQATAEHKEVKARRVEADRAEKAAKPVKPAKAKAVGNGKAAKAADEGE